jgi:flagellar basal-body rod protein FlgB
MKINDFLFNRISIPDLGKSLDAYSMRQKAISNNIANVNTPGYKAERVSFEKEYKKAIYGSGVKADKTNEKHIQIGTRRLQNLHPEVKLRDDRVNDSGINNVDIDFEMSKMAENNLRYQISAELVKKRFRLLQSSIKGR